VSASSTHASFVGSIPENYDRYLGPMLFEFTGADMARRIEEHTSHSARVLEVACGTGISTRHLATTLPPGTEITATDLNQAMLDHASKSNGGLPGVTYSQADALDLPFADDSFDAVACPFGIMFFPDMLKGMSEMARVLKPGGVLALNVWDSFEHNPSVGLANRVVQQFFENDPPKFLEVPFGTVTAERGRELYLATGFEDVEIDHISEAVEIEDHHLPARGFITGNPTILEVKERATVDADEIIAALADALATEFGPAPTTLSFQAIVFAGRKPTP